MRTPMKLRSAGLALVAAAMLSASPVRQSLAQGEAPTFAVAEIQYVDTSGEVIDQSADHVRRLGHRRAVDGHLPQAWRKQTGDQGTGGDRLDDRLEGGLGDSVGRGTSGMRKC